MIMRFLLGLGAGPLVSMAGAAFSIVFFVLTFWFSRRMAARSLNLEASKMLFEIDRQMITEPKLWGFYDDHRCDAEFNDSSPQFRAKLEAFAYLQLNMFEIVLLEVPKPGRRGNRNPSKIWYNFFYDSLSRSSLMRSILERPNSAEIYNSVLITLYTQWKKRTVAD
jgi:hypothetical protein